MGHVWGLRVEAGPGQVPRGVGIIQAYVACGASNEPKAVVLWPADPHRSTPYLTAEFLSQLNVKLD